MQCWRMTFHRSAEAGSAPSSGSVPCPEKEMTSPTRHVNEGAGLSMIADGGLLPATIVSGSDTLVAPWLSVTRRRTVYVPAVVYWKVGLIAVESSNCPSPSRSHA